LAVRPRDVSRIKRGGSQRLTPVPVLSEYPKSPLARGPPATPIKP
jgi:hypothetical protein